MSNPTPQVPASGSPLAAWLAYIETIHPSAIEMGLERVRRVYERLDVRPRCPVIVVAGTNGKGSTCAMLEAMLRAGGFRTTLYTSPHLLEFNERVQVDGRPVSDRALVDAFEQVDAARCRDVVVELTYFEFTTLASLVVFARESPDCMILEVGLGGRLDAVNVVDADCAVLTSVDLDHQAYLGDTREAIGWEKSHVFRPGRPAICADPRPPQSVMEVADRIGAGLLRIGQDFGYAGQHDDRVRQWKFWFRRADGTAVTRNGLNYPGLRGANQLLNASAAMAALETLRDRLPLSMQAIREGLIGVEWPARFQILPGRPVVILDVAHNPHAAAVLADNLSNIGFASCTHAVFGMLADKDVDGVVRLLAPRIDVWHLAGTGGPRGLDSARLAGIVRGAGASGEILEYADPVAAFIAAKARAGEGDRILIFGSFLTVAAVMRYLKTDAPR